MSTALSLPSPAALAEFGDLIERAHAYAADARASSTRRRYRGALAKFEAWCTDKRLSSLPTTPATVALYVTELASNARAVSTIEVTLAAISFAHRSRGLPWPRGNELISEIMHGVRRNLGVAPVTRKAAIEGTRLTQLVATLGTDLRGLRDRAVLCVGWFGAFRRSELVSLTVSDVTETDEGLLVRLRRSKGDQEGHGFIKGIPYASTPSVCPVRALRAWRESACIHEGPLFRGINPAGRAMKTRLCDRSVARIVQAAAEKAGLDPHVLGGHSLRTGFCTTAARRGKSLEAIMRHSGHKDERVAREYIRLATVFTDSAAVGLL